MLEYGLVLEREIHVAGGRFMFEGGEVHVGGGERFMFEGGEVHVGGGRGEVHVGGGEGSCLRGERFVLEGGTAKESLQILDLVVGISGYVISNHV